MGFRSTGGGLGGTGLLTGPPSESIDLGDAPQQGVSNRVSLIDHQHAFPAPEAAPLDLAAAAGIGASNKPARQDHRHRHRALDHQPGGFADLSAHYARAPFAARVATGNVPAAGTVDVVVNFPQAFPDLAYTVEAAVEEATAGDTLRIRKIVSKTAGSVTVRVANQDALVARSGTLHVLAYHDSVVVANSRGGVFYAADYAVGGGAVDDTAGLQAAVNAASAAGGGAVWFSGGSLYSVTALTVPANVALVAGDGRKPIIEMRNPVAGSLVTGSGGGLGSEISVTAAVPAGATTLAVADTSTLAAGDYVFLADTTKYGDGAAAFNGEMVRVHAVTTATEITLATPTFDAYAATPTIRKLTTVDNITIQGIHFRNPAPSTNTKEALTFHHCRNLKVLGCLFEGIDGPGMTAHYSIQVEVRGNEFRNLTDSPSNGRFGYGVQLEGACHDVAITGNSFVRCRHGFTTGDATAGHPTDVLVADNRVMGCTAAGLDTHRSGLGIVFADNLISSGTAFGSGIQVRARMVTVKGNVIQGVRANPIFLARNVSRLRLLANLIIDAGAHAINFDPAAVAHDVVIADNTLINLSQHGIVFIGTGDRLLVANNRIRRTGPTSTAVVVGPAAASTGTLVRGNDISEANFAIRVTNALAVGTVVEDNTASALAATTAVLTLEGGATARNGRNRNLDLASAYDRIDFGPDGSVARDTNLYRSAADQLTTDDALDVVGRFRAIEAGAVSAIFAQFGAGGTTGMWQFQNFGDPTTRRILRGFAGSTVGLTLDPGAGITLEDARNLVVGPVTGTMIGTAPGQKLGFFGAGPRVQPAANPDTAGATLAALEVEVNELKALLRNLGLMAAV